MIDGIFTQDIKSLDEVMPYSPYPTYPSGLRPEDDPKYRFSPNYATNPTLIIIDPIYTPNGDVIPAGHYELELDEEREFIKIIQGHYIIAKIPAFKVQEDKIEAQKIYSKKAKFKKYFERKKQAKIDKKHAYFGIPKKESEVYSNATIEYIKDGQYYLIMYERGRIRAWSAIKSYQ